MYNGVGLRTVRGSGTSGHIQKNLSAYVPKQWEKKDDRDLNSKSRPKIPRIARHDPELIEHERLRKIELELLQFIEEQESMGLKGADLEDVVDKKREELASLLRKGSYSITNSGHGYDYSDTNQENGFVSSQFGTDVDRLDSNQLSRLKEEELRVFRKALGLEKSTRGRHKQRESNLKDGNILTYRNNTRKEDCEDSEERGRNIGREREFPGRVDEVSFDSESKLSYNDHKEFEQDLRKSQKFKNSVYFKKQTSFNNSENVKETQNKYKPDPHSQLYLSSHSEFRSKSRSHSPSHSHPFSSSCSRSRSRSYSHSNSNSNSNFNSNPHSHSESHSKLRSSYYTLNSYTPRKNSSLHTKSFKKKAKREKYSSSARNLAELSSIERRKKHRYRRPRRSRSPSTISRYRSFSRSLSP